MPALSDGDQEATDHGNLMDLEVVEVERESVEGAEGQDDQSTGETFFRFTGLFVPCAGSKVSGQDCPKRRLYR